MEKKNIDWGNIGFGYIQTDYRYVSNYKNGAWDEGGLTQDANIVLNECAGVLQYAQTVFEGLKAYTTSDGRTVVFRPDLNGERLEQSAARLEMPIFPKERFVEAIKQVVKANEAYVPPYGSGATLYLRPLLIGVGDIIGVHPADGGPLLQRGLAGARCSTRHELYRHRQGLSHYPWGEGEPG